MAHVSPAAVPRRVIQRLLIANRGEIARRIIRTARAMGIDTVAVYADGDADAPFVREADRAVALRGRSSAQTYLDAAKVIAAARASGADAIHPGYGFLSENAGFAQQVIDAGLIWVGPAPDAIRRIGDKLAAKQVVRAVSVPTLQEHAIKVTAGSGDAPDAVAEKEALEAAQHIGYPILIKASAGGGGRGMRIVESPAQLPAAIASARREAATSFGDGTVFMERWLTASRHVEIQILGDQHGKLLHLFERECSIQRRHQKIIEEAPSPALNPSLRERMAQAALSAARAIGYYSAGTVEFLVSGDEFFFLEVNTRLQVEHPVTEAITGLDLVREQLLVAQGEPLLHEQSALAIHGHAIEARLCAEDPARGFLPTPGTVAVWEPAQGEGLRFDAGIESGSTIGIEFDPMIAKVIAHAPTRREAALKLARALEATRLQGLTHNRDHLVAILRSPAFLAGDTTTDFLTRVAPPLQRSLPASAVQAAAIAAALFARAQRRAAAKVQKTLPAGFRNSVMPAQQVSYCLGAGVVVAQGKGATTSEATAGATSTGNAAATKSSESATLLLAYRTLRNGDVSCEVQGQTLTVRIHQVGAQGIDLDIDGQRSRHAVRLEGERCFVHGPDGDIELIEQPRLPALDRGVFSGGLRAPMPGKVLAVSVKAGDAVERGQALMVLEAMKMEHVITAPATGTVTAVRVAAGEQVANGAVMIEMEEKKES